MQSASPSVDDQLRTILRNDWGYEDFLPLQLPAMRAVMEDRDSVVVLPTGAGKSLCYQAPAMCREGMAVVVSPLISLMKDQVDALVANGIPAAFINSTLTATEKWEIADRMASGDLKILYVAPERLTGTKLLARFEQTRISFFAIDEAHCVSHWGHDFRPQYRELAILRDRFPDLAVHAYTATATEKVRQDVAGQLRLRDPEVLIGSFDRPNLHYRIARKQSAVQQACDVIRRHPGQAGIVYCISRKEVDSVTAQLNEFGYRARAYHAGMSDADRKSNQDDFIADRVQIIVATVAFGMGIDKPDVRYVIHLGAPKTIENYQQESGRAGRDGLPAECHLFHGGGDFQTWCRIFSDQPPDRYQASLDSLRATMDFCTSMMCRHRALVRHFGQDLKQDCGTACDVCLGEIELVENPLRYGQMILSSVYRQQQKFGMEYTALVLKGSTDQRVLANRHDELSTYGLLKDIPKSAIMDWIGQLTQQGFLERVGEYGVLRITESGSALLRGEQVPKLTRAPLEKKASPQKKAASRSASVADLTDEERELFESLRKLRTEKAAERGLPPYMIFGDATLVDMSRRRPSSKTGFLQVQGVGQKKCEEFGDAFLDAIREHCGAHDLSLDVEQGRSVATTPPSPQSRPPQGTSVMAFPMFEEGMSVADVAEKTGRKPSTVHGYLCDYLRARQICDPSAWVDQTISQRIEDAIDEIQPTRLKPLFEYFDGEIDYETLRIVSTCYQNQLAAVESDPESEGSTG